MNDDDEDMLASMFLAALTVLAVLFVVVGVGLIAWSFL
jgi:hypothetical protein